MIPCYIACFFFFCLCSISFSSFPSSVPALLSHFYLATVKQRVFQTIVFIEYKRISTKF